MDALSFLMKKRRSKSAPLYVVYGDESFLKRQVMEVVQRTAIGDVEPEYAVTRFGSDETAFSTVRNELDSVSFFSDRRLVIVDGADDFISANRDRLEAYLEDPAEKGTLLLDVKSFPATTKLAKKLPDEAKLECRTPAERILVRWCVDWARERYHKQLSLSAAELLVQLVGSAMGIIDQELQKLRDAVGEAPTIDEAKVEQLVGRTRGAEIFRIMTAVGLGKPAEAMRLLSSLIDDGEEPFRIIAAVGFQLRKLAKAARLITDGMPPEDALSAVGVPAFPNAREDFLRQLRHLGRKRLLRLMDRLVELELGMKGDSPFSPELQLQRFVGLLAAPQ